MANVIKYNTGSVPANAIKSGNFDIGVNFGGYGSTSATNYYNGRTPNVSGYTIYQANGVSSPILYAAANDDELIVYSNQLGGSGNSTIGQALTYFRSSSAMTCVNVDYSNIVTSGLTLNLDAGFTPSYPRTGTTWTDISGSGNTGTLVNGPVYSSAGGGCIVSDGSDDGVTVPDSINLDLTNFTLDGWVWFNQHKDYGSLLVKGTGGNGSLFNYCFFFYASSLVCGFGNGSNFYSAGVLTTPNVPINTWHHIVGVYNSVAISFYLNGVLMQSNPIVATPYQNTNNLNIIQSDYPIDGKVISAKVYNRALSATEILQNYYAGLQRLIPTDGLILYLDGNNTNKQVMTASTANDISGNNYNGTLINGVTLSRDGQRSFSFDGVDDYITLGDISSLGFTSGVFTLQAWVKISSSWTSGSQYPNLISKGASAGWDNDGWSLFVFRDYPSPGQYSWGCGIRQGATPLITSNYNVSTNTYLHIVATADGSNVKLYQNGVLVNTNPQTVNPGLNTKEVLIGKTWTNNYFNGNVGQVRIYNRALTATEISTIYTATKSRYGY